MIRFILVFSLFCLYLVCTLVIVPFVLLIGVFDRKRRDMIFLRMVQGAFKVFLFIVGTKLEVIGEENIPKDTAVLYVGNHRSYFDILVSYSRCPGRTGYVAKKSLKKVPLLNMWMSFLYCLFLDRDNMKEGVKMMRTGAEYLKNGISVCIFPEGTRGEVEGELLPFKEGSLKMAQKAGAPIVPMALSNTYSLWEKQFPRMCPAHVILEYGKPIYIDQLDKEEKKHLGGYTRTIIQQMLDKNTPDIQEDGDEQD